MIIRFIWLQLLLTHHSKLSQIPLYIVMSPCFHGLCKPYICLPQKAIMSNTAKTVITVAVEINASIEKVWRLWTTPADIMQWNNTNSDWHNLKVENDLRPGGRFLFAMAAKDGSDKFDFAGIYEVKIHELISYTLDDGRQTTNVFTPGNPVVITESFDAEPTLPIDMQRGFCEGVLASFKRYAEEDVG